MPNETVEPEMPRGNRMGYDGAEMLMTLWVLQRHTDKDHPLLAREVQKKALEDFPGENVPSDKKFRKCLEALTAWVERVEPGWDEQFERRYGGRVGEDERLADAGLPADAEVDEHGEQPEGSVQPVGGEQTEGDAQSAGGELVEPAAQAADGEQVECAAQIADDGHVECVGQPADDGQAEHDVQAAGEEQPAAGGQAECAEQPTADELPEGDAQPAADEQAERIGEPLRDERPDPVPASPEPLAPDGPWYCAPICPIRTTRASKVVYYYMSRDLDPDLRSLNEELGVSLDADTWAQIERAVPTAGQGGSDSVLERSTVETLAMVVRLRRAIREKKAVSFLVAGFRRFGRMKENGTYPVNGAQGLNVVNDTNRERVGRWPYAVKLMDGQYYLLVNASGKRDKFAPCRLADMFELRVIDPENTYDPINDTITELKPRRDYDDLVAGYYDGAVLGWGSSKRGKDGKPAKADIKLLCKGDGFHDAYVAFHDFEGFAVYKGKEAERLDAIEASERPGGRQSRSSNAWYMMKFKAHPHGVEEWVKRHLRDAMLLEPVKSAEQVQNYQDAIRMDRWDQILRSESCKKAAAQMPPEIAALTGLDEDEKKLLAAYRTYKRDRKSSEDVQGEGSEGEQPAASPAEKAPEDAVE